MTVLEEICCHESAHAACALGHGAILTGINADGYNNESRMRHPGNYGNERINEVIMIALVGPCAEAKAQGTLFVSPELYQDDVKDLLRMLSVGGRYTLPNDWTVDDFWAANAAPARLFVERHWGLIQALATELHKRVRMSGQQTAKFLEDRAGLPAGVRPWQEHGN